ncbi:MAG TPA: prepilin-type N-terminal cleavage/methylation domain-containing protein [Gemmatimonadaceae bacterium]|jgi:prepilin-type N-terminal cleavage/methylation domain-containing protein|nr:prepilin-type N-terminal cleavage/methylation domain-containing protein [Gemmatimonadaceae bacterium]
MSSRLRRRRRLTRPRRGFTVIEMIIAIIVMAIGVMGLAGTARYVAMQMGNGRTQTIAATFATKVADSLSARRCSSIVGGTQTKRGVTITWTVADSTKTKWVTESVQYRTKSGAKTVNYLTVIQCPD